MEIEANSCKIVKRVIHVGSASINFVPETKVSKFSISIHFANDMNILSSLCYTELVLLF